MRVPSVLGPFETLAGSTLVAGSDRRTRFLNPPRRPGRDQRRGGLRWGLPYRPQGLPLSLPRDPLRGAGRKAIWTGPTPHLGGCVASRSAKRQTVTGSGGSAEWPTLSAAATMPQRRSGGLGSVPPLKGRRSRVGAANDGGDETCPSPRGSTKCLTPRRSGWCSFSESPLPPSGSGAMTPLALTTTPTRRARRRQRSTGNAGWTKTLRTATTASWGGSRHRGRLDGAAEAGLRAKPSCQSLTDAEASAR